MDRPVRLVPALLLAASCTGIIDDPRGAEGGEGYPSSTTPSPEECESVPRTMAVPARRLSIEEYEAAVEALFGAGAPSVADVYPVGLRGHDFSTIAGTDRVNELDAEAFLLAAERVAEHLAPSLPACAGEPVQACAQAYFEPIAARAYRRSDVAEDAARLAGIARDAATDGLAPNEAIAVAIVALLMEPRFLYVVDSRPEPSFSLDANERAARLALTYWHELPDDALLARAAAGELDTSAGMEAEAARVVGDPRTRAAFHEFVREWLGLSVLPDVHDAALRDALDRELGLLIDAAWEAEDGVGALLASDAAYVDTVLETFYGVDAGSSGPGDFRRVSMPDRRAGLLTHPLVLAAASHGDQSSVILRGKLVRTRLLCADLPPPPPGAQAAEPDLPATATPRERYEARIEQAQCRGCHELLDPIGFAFERYDGLGRLRSEVGGRPIDELGDIRAGGDATSTFTGPHELAAVLARSEHVSQCFATQFLRYALARESGRDSACVELDLAGTLRDSGRSIPALFEGLAAHPAFVDRTGEVSP